MLRGLVVMCLAIGSEIPSSNPGSDKHFLIIFHLKMFFFYVKMAVLYENVINLIILERLKVLFSNILLKKYHSSMKCGQDKKK